MEPSATARPSATGSTARAAWRSHPRRRRRPRSRAGASGSSRSSARGSTSCAAASPCWRAGVTTSHDLMISFLCRVFFNLLGPCEFVLGSCKAV